MRKNVLAALVLSLAVAAPTLASADGWRRGGYHGGHGYGHARHWHARPRIFFGYGAPWYAWGPTRYGWWGPPPVYVERRTLVRDEPVYIERGDSADAYESDSPDGYWYFCRSEDGYYPDVEHCPEPWVPVPPRGQ